MAGFVYAPYGDLDAVARLIDGETAAIMIEPIQGEGGVRIAARRFPGRAAQTGRRARAAPGLRRSPDRLRPHGQLVRLSAGCSVTPDIMTLAKALCGGLAGGAMLTRPEIAPSLRPGMHASTFGGNPIAAAGGLAAVRMIEEGNLLERARCDWARSSGRGSRIWPGSARSFARCGSRD